MPANRRHPFLLGAALALGFLAPALAQDEAAAQGADKVWHHGSSIYGNLKYPEGFQRFDYVNPDAPKGGRVRFSDQGGFDTLNPLPMKGELASGIGLVYETLMVPSLDEVFTQYGRLAEAVSFPDDYSSVSFRLDPDARWHDGQPVTADDVLWSFSKAIELNAGQANYYHNVTSAEITGEREVTFGFDETGNRELPLIMSQLLVLPRHWWEGTDANGRQRDIAAPTLEAPMGSGPYRVSSVNPGTSIAYERVDDYWGAGKPFGIGQYNFDEIRYEFFRDTDVAFEAFKGDQFDWWDENAARRWATGYDFPAVAEGRVVKEELENDYRDSGVLVGFLLNTRLDKFKDQRVRRAINYAFDFEELNRIRFYGQYARIDSYFFGSELASSGLPEGKELEILETVRGQVPDTVFTTPYANPVAGDPQKLRANLAEALRLLTEAGYSLDGNRLVDANGTQLSFEILLNGPTIEPIAQAWQTNLRRIGIEASIRSVDSSQFINRLNAHDFDTVYNGWGQSISPGNEQRNYWGSASANEPDTANHTGIADPAVDALVNRVIFAPDRDTLVAATRALDRVLLHLDLVVPSYTIRLSRIARWDRFGRPDTLPEYAVGFPTIWWWDAEKAAKTGGR